MAWSMDAAANVTVSCRTTDRGRSTRPAGRAAPSVGVRGAVSGSLERIRSGDLGVVPVVAALVVIWTVFQVHNPIFLSPANS
jgi:hypothetical protein